MTMYHPPILWTGILPLLPFFTWSPYSHPHTLFLNIALIPCIPQIRNLFVLPCITISIPKIDAVWCSVKTYSRCGLMLVTTTCATSLCFRYLWPDTSGSGAVYERYSVVQETVNTGIYSKTKLRGQSISVGRRELLAFGIWTESGGER